MAADKVALDMLELGMVGLRMSGHCTVDQGNLASVVAVAAVEGRHKQAEVVQS